MKSQSIVAFGEPLESTTTDTPVPTGSQVLLKVTHCGVCHSDVHLHDGHFDMGGGNKLESKLNTAIFGEPTRTSFNVVMPIVSQSALEIFVPLRTLTS